MPWSCNRMGCHVFLKIRIRRILLLLACSVILTLRTSTCLAQTQTGGREDFAEVAQKLRAFPPDGKFLANPGDMHMLGRRMEMMHDIAFGRPATPGTAEYHALINTDYPLPFLLSLLKDRDAKIRTLAAAAIVAKGNPRLQQYLAPLVRDPSPTFDVMTTFPTGQYTEPQYMPQTVSVAVLRLVEMPSPDKFDQYWSTRANRDYCASWFLWQFLHPPFASMAKERIQRLPSPERELTILWIGKGESNRLSERFTGYSDQELLDAAKRLWRENVLEVLRGDPRTSDPDIRDVDQDNARPPAMDSSYGHALEFGNFLLTHAKDPLTDSDAKTLLELGTGRNSRIPASPELWFVAAANLRPQDADSILGVAELLWPLAGDIQLTRWDIHGRTALPKILERFYHSPETQEALACSIPDESYRSLVEAILASDGHLQISGKAMYYLGYLTTRTWKSNFDNQIIDWVFAQAPDPDIGIMGPPRDLVVRSSGVARKLVPDPRFNNADGQLLYVVEQCLVGDLKLNHAQSVRLDQLIKQLYSQHPKSSPESTLQEAQDLLRLGVSNN